MKLSKKIGTVIGCVSLFAGAHTASAQTTGTQMSVLHFTFRDSARGTLVRPDAVLVDNKVVFNTIDEAGRMSVTVSPGDHQVLVKAEGYDDLDSRQTAAVDYAPMNVIMLDPAEEPEELRPDKLSDGMPADGTSIAGFVVDDSVGKPVVGAEVELLNKDIKTTTDERGFFKLPVPLPDGKPMPENLTGVVFSTRDIKVSKPGYGFEERLNVLVESGTPRVYQFSMIRGGGGNSVDETAGRNNLQSSLFGLRNVEPEDEPSTYSMPLNDIGTTPTNGTTTGTATTASGDLPHDHSHGDGHTH